MGISISAVTRPGAALQTADNKQIGVLPAATNPSALHIEEYTGVVEGTIARRSIMSQLNVPIRSVTGTDVVSSFRVGEATMQKMTPGVELDPTLVQANKVSLRVDTTVALRNYTPTIDDFQNSYDARSAVGQEHGKAMAKFYDQAHLIQAIKASQIADVSNAAGYPAGWKPGTQVVLGAANDEKDPAKLEAAFASLFAQMEEKDVDPIDDDIIIVSRPATRYTLLQNDRMIDREYVTSDGTNIKTKAIEAYGVPMFGSNNLPNAAITGHFLSNLGNANAYDGDFSRVVAIAFSPRALLAGETIPLQTAVWWDDRTKGWFIDAWTAFGVTPNNPAFAGVILKAAS